MFTTGGNYLDTVVMDNPYNTLARSLSGNPLLLRWPKPKLFASFLTVLWRDGYVLAICLIPEFACLSDKEQLNQGKSLRTMNIYFPLLLIEKAVIETGKFSIPGFCHLPRGPQSWAEKSCR